MPIPVILRDLEDRVIPYDGDLSSVALDDIGVLVMPAGVQSLRVFAWHCEKVNGIHSVVFREVRHAYILPTK
jgi:hypothetical protein